MMLKGYTSLQKFTTIFAYFVGLVGISSMVAAGYLLINGLSNFGGGQLNSSFIAIGMLFQVTESICFIGSALPYCSITLRATLLVLGCVLFSFSIGVMTLAQKTALESSQAQANTIDDKRARLESQIKSLDSVILGLKVNGNKQTKSRFVQSRIAGQNALLQAASLIEKQTQLIIDLEKTRNSRQQTSQDFFQNTKSVINWNAKDAEFYFLISRSLLIELCAIVMMYFSTYLFGKVSNDCTEKSSNDVTGLGKSVTETVEKPVTEPVTEQKQQSVIKQQDTVDSSNIITPFPAKKEGKSSNRKSSALVTKKYQKQYNDFVKMVRKGTVKITNKGVREAVGVGTDNASNFLNQAVTDHYLINHGPGKGYSRNLH